MNHLQEVAEQRRAIRYACVLEASVPRVGSRIFEPVLLAKVANISTGGIGLHCSEKIEAGSILTLKLYKRERDSLPPRQARVVHISEQFNGTWKIGAEFLEPLAEAEMQSLLE